jgi:cytochrome c oxidase accessory protein FixG
MSTRWAAGRSDAVYHDGKIAAKAMTAIGSGDGDDGPLYAPGKRVFPQSVSGTYRTIKWIVLAVTLGIYYALPFVRWDRGPNAPGQAVLIDFPGRRFYFFFIEIWPQEIYYLTGLLVLAAMALFFMNAVAGRVWCGYLCPQTVWTDLFYAVERFFEGDRRERMRNAAARLTPAIVARKAAKHATWLIIAWWTGGAWVLYFSDAPTLVRDLATFNAPAVAWIWIGILTFTTYSLAGFMREQVCTYMCPWPRIQAALTDEHALNVTYRFDRGEPRGSLKRNEMLREQGRPAGDCIDCGQCVAVCPTGVDIRKGLQIDCIQCGLCIDACDTVMAKIDRPARLIAYDTDLNVRRRQRGEAPRYNLVRSRTILYAVIMLAVGGIMVFALATRDLSGISVIHDRNPLFIALKDGSVRNAYTVRVLNKALETRRFALTLEGLAGGEIEIVGAGNSATPDRVIEVGPDRTQEVRVLVTRHGAPLAEDSVPVTFVITDQTTGTAISVSDNFRGPHK